MKNVGFIFFQPNNFAQWSHRMNGCASFSIIFSAKDDCSCPFSDFFTPCIRPGDQPGDCHTVMINRHKAMHGAAEAD